LCSSRYALEEAKINLKEEGQRKRLAELARSLESSTGTAQLPEEITLPDKDLPILHAAMQASATHLITGDLRHFGLYFGKPSRAFELNCPRII